MNIVNNSYPKISVITPTFNQGAFIEKTINSVLSQNYPNLEFIVIDGGSTDNTVEIIKKYEKHLTYWVSERDRGQSHAINKGMALASGDLLTWLNSDDWFTSGALQKFADVFSQYPDAGMIVGAGQAIDQTGKSIYYKEPTNPITLETLYEWFDGGFFVQSSGIFSREAWIRCGPLDENEHIAMDLDLWLKIARAGYLFVPHKELLSEVLIHPDAKTTAFESLMRVEGLLVIAKHGGTGALKTGMIKMNKQIDDLTRRLSWYERNYEIIVNHPLTRLLRPIVKRLAKKDDYWQDKVPPWVK
ncbi:MAG: glycosyltransferase family 2 protein [Methylococcales bacterium]|nr:glycosyltransferase family 2 protein [Methylococcales bacterium]